jgi:hypothetical protein
MNLKSVSNCSNFSVQNMRRNYIDLALTLRGVGPEPNTVGYCSSTGPIGFDITQLMKVN